MLDWFFWILGLIVLLFLYRAPLLWRDLRPAEGRTIDDRRRACLTQFGLLLLDIPVGICLVLTLAMPWRTLFIVYDLWKTVRRLRGGGDFDLMGRRVRTVIVYHAVMALTDPFVLVMAVFLLLSGYRMYKTVREIYASNLDLIRTPVVSVRVALNFLYLVVDLPFLFLGFILCCTLIRVPGLWNAFRSVALVWLF